jgi:undecaprenyl-diphosphatase
MSKEYDVEQLSHPPGMIPDEREQLDQSFPGPDRLRRMFRRLDAREARFVRVVMSYSRGRPRLHGVNAFLNLMGNGWLYLPLAILVPLLKGWQSWRFMLAASLSVVAAHSLYHWIKLRLARLRPYDVDPTLGATIKALDKYSCPSGHCMTAAAVGIPLALAFPPTLPAMAFIWLLIAWSRVSLGHHYPTDLLLGGLIGAFISVPISMLIL